MAGAFACDPEVAAEVARELAQIRADMEAMGLAADGHGEATGSRPVAGALERFVAESSDNRANMARLLDRASGLLRGLSEGTTAVDSALAGALEPAAPGSRR
jgi:hypothetical protein